VAPVKAAGTEDPHLAYLLHMATRRLRAEAEAATSSTLTPLRAAQVRLLDRIPAEGGRVTELSEAVRVSKQGLGQLANHLAQLGYVEVVPDPADRRAKLVRRTPSGDQVCSEMRATVAAIEGRWAADVGARKYAAFRDVLRTLVAEFD